MTLVKLTYKDDASDENFNTQHKFIFPYQIYWDDIGEYNYIGFRWTILWYIIFILYSVFTTPSQVSFYHHLSLPPSSNLNSFMRSDAGLSIVSTDHEDEPWPWGILTLSLQPATADRCYQSSVGSTHSVIEGWKRKQSWYIKKDTESETIAPYKLLIPLISWNVSNQ